MSNLSVSSALPKDGAGAHISICLGLSGRDIQASRLDQYLVIRIGDITILVSPDQWAALKGLGDDALATLPVPEAVPA